MRPISIRVRSCAAAALAVGLATTAIGDTPTLRVLDSGLARPTWAEAPMSFSLARTGNTRDRLGVRFRTRDDTARAGVDYVATRGVATIPAGAVSATIEVPILPGRASRPKDFLVELTQVRGPLDASVLGVALTSGDSQPARIATADFNRDGSIDLASMDGDGDMISVFLDTLGPGIAFDPAASFALPGKPGSIAVADFNGDGTADLVATVDFDGDVSRDSDGFLILSNVTERGSSRVRFGQRARIAAATGIKPEYFLAVDLNRDRKPDLAYADAGGITISVNTTPDGAARPTFAEPVVFNNVERSDRLVAADLDGDGRVDLASTQVCASKVSLLLNRTQGRGGPVRFVESGAIEITPLSCTGGGAVAILGSGGDLIAAPDVNADGKADLVVIDGVSALLNFGGGGSEPRRDFGRVRVLLNTRTASGDVPTFSTAVEIPTGLRLNESLAIADFNADGRADLGVTTRDSLSILLNQTGASATAPVFAAPDRFGPQIDSRHLVIADFDRDSAPDVAIAGGESKRVLVIRNLTAAQSQRARLATSREFPDRPVQGQSAAVDVNNDGRVDLVQPGVDGVSVLLNATANPADPMLAAPQTVGIDTLVPGLAAADFNADGRIDIAAPQFPGARVNILRNDTVAGRDDVKLVNAGGFSTSTPGTLGIVAADFNLDGRPDLATSMPGSAFSIGSIAFAMNRTRPGSRNLRFTADALILDLSAGELVAADFNADGKPDLATVNPGDAVVGPFAEVRVLINKTLPGDAAPSFGSPLTPSASSPFSPFGIAAFDANRDGRADLAVGGNGGVSVFLSQQPQAGADAAFAEGLRLALPSAGPFTEPNDVDAADIDGDGAVDLVSRSGVADVFLNDTPVGAAVAAFSPAVLLAPFTRVPDESCPCAIAAGDLDGDGAAEILVPTPTSIAVIKPAFLRASIEISGVPAVGTIFPNRGDKPRPFHFTDRTEVEPRSTQISDTIEVTSLAAPAAIQVIGGLYSVNGGAFSSEARTVAQGDTVRVRHRSARGFLSDTSTTLTIAGVSDTFTTTTRAAEGATPDP